MQYIYIRTSGQISRPHTTSYFKESKVSEIWNKVGFRNFSGFRNSDSETLSLDSETLSLDSETFASDSKTFSPDSETLSSETFSLDSETLFVGFRNFFRRIQKLFSSDSESLFVGFRNCFRRIQKLFSSDSETLFVGFKNSFRRIQKLFSTHAFNDYYIPFIKNFPPFPLATQPMLSMITTFLSSKFDPPPLATHAFNDSGSSITFLLSRFLHSFYQDFPPSPSGNPTHAVNDYYIPFIKI